MHICLQYFWSYESILYLIITYKILAPDWLSPAMIFAQIGQCNWTVRARACVGREQLHFFLYYAFHGENYFFFMKRFYLISFLNFVIDTINWTLCHPIRSVIILVINHETNQTFPLHVIQFCLSLVWLQTELNSTQSYYHKIIYHLLGNSDQVT